MVKKILCLAFFLLNVLCEVSYYDVLGVSRTSTPEEIRRAYKLLSRKHHPDISDSPDASKKFQEIVEAYEILYNAKSRQIYDQYGKAGLDNNRNSREYDMNDWINEMFKFNQNDEVMEASNKVITVYLSLRQLYEGYKFTVEYEHDVVCENYASCLVDRNDCKSNGVRIEIYRGNYIVQRSVSDPSCVSKGKGLKSGACRACPKSIIFSQKTSVDVTVEPGIRVHEWIVFEKKGDHALNFKPGNLIIIIDEEHTPNFIRKGDVIQTKMSINLIECLVGINRSITHIDGSNINIESNQIIAPGKIFKIAQKGMYNKNKNEYGDLEIVIDVEFPKNFTFEKTDAEQLRAIFSKLNN